MLRDQLLANGVAEDAIDIIPDEASSVTTALNMGQEGDLLVIFADNVRRSWDQVIQFEGENSDGSSAGSTKPSHSFVEPDPEAFSLEAGARLVRDERGVRLAKEQESD